MKNSRLLHSIVLVIVIGILISFIGYTMNPIVKDPLKQPDTVKTDTPDAIKATTDTVKKDSCECCAERKARQQEKVRQARDRRVSKEQNSKVDGP